MLKKVLLCIVFTLVFSTAFAQQSLTPVGKWLTIDDKTGQPRSIVQIWLDQGQLEGKIIKVYYRPGEGPTDVCKKCTDPAHKDKLILGMTILWSMHEQTPNRWVGGYILDPDNGKIYRCQIILQPNNQDLVVHGYIGIPLLGRSQNWIRVDTKHNETK